MQAINIPAKFGLLFLLLKESSDSVPLRQIVMVESFPSSRWRMHWQRTSNTPSSLFNSSFHVTLNDIRSTMYLGLAKPRTAKSDRPSHKTESSHYSPLVFIDPGLRSQHNLWCHTYPCMRFSSFRSLFIQIPFTLLSGVSFEVRQLHDKLSLLVIMIKAVPWSWRRKRRKYKLGLFRVR